MKILKRISKLYYVFAIVLIFLTVVVIFTLQSLFGSLAIAGEIDETLTTSTAPRIDKQNLDEAYEAIKGKEFVPLDLR